MPRPKLNMTTEARREHDRALAKARKQKQRIKEMELKMDQKIAAEMVELAELYELAEELLQMRLPAAIQVVAEWQHENRRPFPALFMEPRADHEPWPTYYARRERARRLGLIRLMAMDHIERVGGRRRKARFDEREAKEAAAHSMTVDAYRRHKKHLKLAAKMEKIVADRTVA